MSDYRLSPEELKKRGMKYRYLSPEERKKDAERLTNSRKLLGMTIKQLSTLSNVKECVISKYENGHTAPNVCTLEAVAWALRQYSDITCQPLPERPDENRYLIYLK